MILTIILLFFLKYPLLVTNNLLCAAIILFNIFIFRIKSARISMILVHCLKIFSMESNFFILLVIRIYSSWLIIIILKLSLWIILMRMNRLCIVTCWVLPILFIVLVIGVKILQGFIFLFFFSFTHLFIYINFI